MPRHNMHVFLRTISLLSDCSG